MLANLAKNITLLTEATKQQINAIVCIWLFI
uniref:Uncharacterized protein n=1 Tax=Anguilla anguilla TaxID=7936 RepID=A0A0E9R9L3_ANGAN